MHGQTAGMGLLPFGTFWHNYNAWLPFCCLCIPMAISVLTATVILLASHPTEQSDRCGASGFHFNSANGSSNIATLNIDGHNPAFVKGPSVLIGTARLGNTLNEAKLVSD